MWLILEGVDGAGKTTLANTLKSSIVDEPAVIHHLGPPESPDTAVAECVDGIDDVLLTTNLISDRHHWGCAVYGPIFRPGADRDGYGDMGRAGWRYVDMFVASRGGIVIYCYEPLETIRERLRDRGDDYIEEHHVTDILVRYGTIALESLCVAGTVTRIAPSSVRTEDLARIAERAKARSDRASWVRYCHGDFIGSLARARAVARATDVSRDGLIDLVEELGDDWSTTVVSLADENQARELAHHLGVPARF